MQELWTPYLSVIEKQCSDFDKVWQIRKRIITTQFLVLFILKLVLSKNSQGYKILLHQMWEEDEISELQSTPISASSLCEARQKMPEDIFLQINQEILSIRESRSSLPLWKGHRVYGVDGTKINLPMELKNEGYESRYRHQSYPHGLLSTLYHLGSGLVYDAILSANQNERFSLLSHMEKLSPGDVLVLDRGYFSYLILTKAIEKGIHLICRMKSGTVNNKIKDFWHSDEVDKVITYKPSTAVKFESKKQGYDIELKPLKLRLLKYTIDKNTYVCATTLLDKAYQVSEFSEVYHGRWGIEELYKISKKLIEIEDFHGKTERTVKQECYAHILFINIARIFEFETDENFPPPPPNLPNDHKGDSLKSGYWQSFCSEIKTIKVNFKNCLMVVSRKLEKLFMPFAGEDFSWISAMLISISKLRQKIRPGRHVPRKSLKPISKWRNGNGGSTANA